MTRRISLAWLWHKLKSWMSPRSKAQPPLDDRQRAQHLIAAIDAGGIPLNPARVNQIARSLGLEVSRNAPVTDTIARIRTALRNTSY